MKKGFVFMRFNDIMLLGVCVFLCLCVLTGCDNAVRDNETCYVKFTDGGESGFRGLVTDEKDEASFDNLVWAYIAVKKDGMHTVGASEEVTSHTDGVTAKDSADRIYTLRPVREDYSKGLDMENGPFSYGEWEFRLYGYKSYDGSKFNDLVYTGVTVPGLTVINPLSATEIAGGVTSVSVPFTLTDKRTDNKGKLVLGDIYFSVPDGLTLPNGSTLTVTIKQGVFTSTATEALTVEAHTGDRIGPLTFSSTSEEWAEGTYTLTVDAEVTPSGGSAESITETFAYPLVISRGVTSTVSGDISNLKTTTNEVYEAGFNVPLCKIDSTTGTTATTNYYYDLQSAVDALLTDGGDFIDVIRNIDDAGTVTFTGNGSVIVNLNGFSISNLQFVKPDKVGNIEIMPGSDTTNYIVLWGSGCYVKNIYADSTSKTLWLNTISGNVGCVAPDYNIWHSGSVDTLHLYYSARNKASNLGYHLLCDVYEELALKTESGKASTGKFLDMGVVCIKKLDLGDVTQSAVTLRGVTGTWIGNITGIRDSYDSLNGKAIASALVTVKVHLCRWSETLYGIEGTIMNLKDVMVEENKVLYWFMDEEMYMPLVNADTYQVGANTELYGAGKIPLGGTVFYVDTSVSVGTNCRYIFYNSSGGVISRNPSSVGTDAKYYMIIGKQPTKDRYYVYNKNVSTGGYKSWCNASGVGTAVVPLNYTVDSVTYTREELVSPDNSIWNIVEANLTVGNGRKNTEFFMNNRVNITGMNCANYVNNSSTVWYYLKNSVNVSGGVGSTKLYDWYVPSAGEMLKMYAKDSSVYVPGSSDGFYLGSSSLCHTSSGGGARQGFGFYGLWKNTSSSTPGALLKGFGDKTNSSYTPRFYFIRSF